MKVLTVDDSAMIRKIVRGAVEVLDFELLEASDGIEALTVLEREAPGIGLILLDWNMPGMNGFEFLQVIKDHPGYKRIPVMMVTTESEKENIVRAIQAGASHYLVKPFTMEDLLKKMMESLGRGES